MKKLNYVIYYVRDNFDYSLVTTGLYTGSTVCEIACVKNVKQAFNLINNLNAYGLHENDKTVYQFKASTKDCFIEDFNWEYLYNKMQGKTVDTASIDAMFKSVIDE